MLRDAYGFSFLEFLLCLLIVSLLMQSFATLSSSIAAQGKLNNTLMLIDESLLQLNSRYRGKRQALAGVYVNWRENLLSQMNGQQVAIEKNKNYVHITWHARAKYWHCHSQQLLGVDCYEFYLP